MIKTHFFTEFEQAGPLLLGAQILFWFPMSHEELAWLVLSLLLSGGDPL